MEPTYEITPEPTDDERKVIVLALERERLEALGYKPGERKWRRGVGWQRVVARNWDEAVRLDDVPEAGTGA